MKTILVPTDFSKHSDWAMEAAVSLAKKLKAALHLIHVVDMPQYAFSAAHEMWNMEERQRVVGETYQKLKALSQEPPLAELPVQIAVEQGSAYQMICQYASDKSIDLIVMGSHGITGLRKIFIGSVTERVIHHAPCPVLSIKHEHQAMNFRNIVFASNFYQEAVEAFGAVQHFAELFGAKIHLVRINTQARFESTRFANKLLRDFVEQVKPKNYTINIYNDESEEIGVLNFAEDIEADLIALPTHERTRISELINPSIAESVSERSPIPVMTIKIPTPAFRYELSRADRTYLA
ncbi:MAG: universal stress protein [Chloroherpetonaceae bacterium]|nr:universal stress protein [Chloroherpetonaceae bacterium]MCS7211001.1 universal stress protein [Chloroherpetonaceae bacterium]MDW8018489.1 universal stress protein [Chloroherpetonaceae bacterium]